MTITITEIGESDNEVEFLVEMDPETHAILASMAEEAGEPIDIFLLTLIKTRLRKEIEEEKAKQAAGPDSDPAEDA